MYGRTLLNGNNVIQPTRLSADGNPQVKAGGVTIDWTTVAATGTAVTTLGDGSTVAPATKYLRYGQPITKITDTSSASVGMFGPYNPSATDGRQTLTKGEVFLLDETVLQYGIAGSTMTGENTQIGGAVEGGLVWYDRMLATSGTGGLSTGIALTNLATVMPALRYVKN